MDGIRILTLLGIAALGASAANIGALECNVNYDNRPNGSQWLGDWNPVLTEERADYQVQLWAQMARHRVVSPEQKKVEGKPAAVKAPKKPEVRRVKAQSGD